MFHVEHITQDAILIPELFHQGMDFMKNVLGLIFLLSAPTARAKDVGCPQIDVSKKYADEIPYCPELIKTNTAFAVTRCAFEQAKEWHKATDGEKVLMAGLVKGMKDADSSAVLSKADALKLQVCRSEKDGDKFLLLYTKPGVKDYSGPFLMYREGGQTSGVVIHSPHDGQDGTHRSTKAAFQDSNALAMISNGHPRRMSGRSGPNETGAYPSDWAHTSSDLGYQAFQSFKNQFPESIHLHIHGLAANRVLITDSVGWKSDHILRTAMHGAVDKALQGRDGFPVVNWRFNGWITGIVMTMNESGKGRAANERWVGMEFSVKLHRETNVLSKSVINLEADYLKKPRPITADLDKDVVPMEGDDVDEKEMENIVVSDAPDEVQPLTDDPINEMEALVFKEKAAANSDSGLPKKRPVVGTRKLACVGISYNSPVNDYMTAARCLKTAKNVSEFYSRNSRGRLKLVPAGYHMKYDGGAWQDFSKAEQVAKKQFDADYYIIPSLFRKGGNHSSGGIAHVVQLTGWVVSHEVGHLLGLGHTGKFVYDRAGKPHYNAYGDRDSVMGGGGTGSSYLTAPQYYGKDWLRDDEVALFDPKTNVYEMKQISHLADSGLATVVVPPSSIRNGDGKHVFLAYASSCDKPCVAAYLSNGVSSQKVGFTKTEYYETAFTDLHIKVLDGAPKGKVRFSVDFAPKPAAFENRLEEEPVEPQTDVVDFTGDDSNDDEDSVPVP